ncbi:hypothetical protein COU79_00765 [Candidatus Peregrinibacteria bacterium CG10_big_fil_rev_8_21_14_0_10_54_7]|nr:MAG: hypothetical protein COU79_00765 [Candidatus Peregrinibacteria bacterium CG10_big_fil_rev_8_21_14_0_10_54_7]
MQTATLQDSVDIKYEAAFANLDEAILKVFKDGSLIIEKTIAGPKHSEILSYSDNQEISKGSYDFVVEWETPTKVDTASSVSIEIPNYLPEANSTYWDAFDPNFKQGEARSLSLKDAFKDNNLEDNPVSIREILAMDGQIEVVSDTLGEYSITALKGGSSELKIKYGSEEGGFGEETINLWIEQIPQSVAQAVTLQDSIDIKYEATFVNLDQATLKVFKDDRSIIEKAIKGPEYLEIFSYIDNEEITKGSYDFVVEWRTSRVDTSVSKSVDIPNYSPEVNMKHIDFDLDENSSIQIQLPIPTDKNPEDNPVQYINIEEIIEPENGSKVTLDTSFAEATTPLTLDEINNIIKSNPNLGASAIRLLGGNPEGLSPEEIAETLFRFQEFASLNVEIIRKALGAITMKLSIQTNSGKFGSYSVKSEFGSNGGGVNYATRDGFIHKLAHIQGILESNETHQGVKGTLRLYDTQWNLLFTNKSDSDGNNFTDDEGGFSLKINKRASDLDTIIVQAGKGIPIEQAGQIRLSEGYIRTVMVGMDDWMRPGKEPVGYEVRIPSDNALIRVVPYGSYENNPEEFKLFMWVLVGQNVRSFDLDGSFIGIRGGGWFSNFKDYKGLEQIRILDHDYFSDGSFTREQQELMKAKILDKDDIGGIIGHYTIDPSMIVFGNDPTFTDYTLGDDDWEVNPRNGVVIVVPRKNLINPSTRDSVGGVTQVYWRISPFITRGGVYIRPNLVQRPDALMFGAIFSHEFGHVFIGSGHPGSLKQDSNMQTLNRSSKMGPADKKAGYIIYEPTLMRTVHLGPVERDVFLDNVLGLDFTPKQQAEKPIVETQRSTEFLPPIPMEEVKPQFQVK